VVPAKRHTKGSVDLGMPKGLLTFGSPKNAQNNDFFMYTKTGLD
jgi:hypothetical protein